jgi:hypothetical protein
MGSPESRVIAGIGKQTGFARLGRIWRKGWKARSFFRRRILESGTSVKGIKAF